MEQVTKVGPGEGGFMVEGRTDGQRSAVWVTPTGEARDFYRIQSGCGVCTVSRSQLRALGEAMVREANRERSG